MGGASGLRGVVGINCAQEREIPIVRFCLIPGSFKRGHLQYVQAQQSAMIDRRGRQSS